MLIIAIFLVIFRDIRAIICCLRLLVLLTHKKHAASAVPRKYLDYFTRSRTQHNSARAFADAYDSPRAPAIDFAARTRAPPVANKTSAVARDDRSPTCSDQEVRCKNSVRPPHCIHYEKLCDGVADCADRSDEEQCADVAQTSPLEVARESARCEHRCANGQCIARSALCNRQYDCSDGTDETTCGAFELNTFFFSLAFALFVFAFNSAPINFLCKRDKLVVILLLGLSICVSEKLLNAFLSISIEKG